MNLSVLMLAARIALAFCLYTFLALVLFTLWRDLYASAGLSAGPPRPNLLRLRDDGTTERVHPLPKDSCFIGRSPSIEVSLADETVSAVHARIWRKEDRWWLEDLDSRNGTLLNQIPVQRRTILCTGDRIRLGRILLEFRSEDSSSAGKNPPAPEADEPA
jgi:hypothetical protein